MPTINLRYFAVFRELLGRTAESLTTPEGLTVAGLLDRLVSETPALAPLRPSVRCVVNHEYVEDSHLLADGDEVAFIPPVSGGGSSESLPAPGETATPRHFVVTADQLDPGAIAALVADPGAGAIITFAGVVRDNARGRAVIGLEYEAYEPVAERFLQQIEAEMKARWPVLRCAIWHRTGRLLIGETSVVIALSVPHRQEGFAASAYAIERLKEIVPIWKKELYADGETWIGSEATYQGLPDRRSAPIATQLE